MIEIQSIIIVFIVFIVVIIQNADAHSPFSAVLGFKPP